MQKQAWNLEAPAFTRRVLPGVLPRSGNQGLSSFGRRDKALGFSLDMMFSTLYKMLQVTEYRMKNDLYRTEVKQSFKGMLSSA